MQKNQNSIVMFALCMAEPVYAIINGSFDEVHWGLITNTADSAVVLV